MGEALWGCLWAVLAGSPGLQHSQAGNENVQTKKTKQPTPNLQWLSEWQHSTQKWWWSPVSFSENRLSGHICFSCLFTQCYYFGFSVVFSDKKKKPRASPVSWLPVRSALRRKTGAERAVAAVQRNNWNQHSHLGDICTCILLSTCLLCLPLRSKKGNKKLLTVS